MRQLAGTKRKYRRAHAAPLARLVSGRAKYNPDARVARNPNSTLPIARHPTRGLSILVATEFTSVVFRILHYRNLPYFRVVQNPENQRNESGGGSNDGLQIRRSQNAHKRHLAVTHYPSSVSIAVAP